MNLHDLRKSLHGASAAHVSGWVVYKARDGVTDMVRDLSSGVLISTADKAATEAWIHRTFYRPGEALPYVTHRLLLTRGPGRIALSDGNQIDLETGAFGRLAPPTSRGRVVPFGQAPERGVA